MTNVAEKVRSVLATTTRPLTVSEIRERAGIASGSALSSALHSMKARGEIVGHQGDSPRRTGYLLAASAPPDCADTISCADQPGGGLMVIWPNLEFYRFSRAETEVLREHLAGRR